MNEEVISNRFVIYLYKYLFIPIFILFFSFGGLITLYNAAGINLKTVILLLIIIFAIIFAIDIWLKLKIINLQEEGISYNHHLIKWTAIENISFINISPGIIKIKFNVNNNIRKIITQVSHLLIRAYG